MLTAGCSAMPLPRQDAQTSPRPRLCLCQMRIAMQPRICVKAVEVSALLDTTPTMVPGWHHACLNCIYDDSLQFLVACHHRCTPYT